TTLAQSLVDVSPAGAGPRFRLFPNPARGRVFLELGVEQKHPISFSLYDVRGSRVLQETLPPFGGTDKAQASIELRDGRGRPIKEGVYFYRAVTQSGTYSGRMTLLR